VLRGDAARRARRQPDGCSFIHEALLGPCRSDGREPGFLALIQAPPGDYLSTYESSLAASGEQVDAERPRCARQHFARNNPSSFNTGKWLRGVCQGRSAFSFEWQQDGVRMIWERMALRRAGRRQLAMHLGGAFRSANLLAVRKYSVRRLPDIVARLHRPGDPSFLLEVV